MYVPTVCAVLCMVLLYTGSTDGYICMYVPVLWRHERNARKFDRYTTVRSRPVISSVV